MISVDFFLSMREILTISITFVDFSRLTAVPLVIGRIFGEYRRSIGVSSGETNRGEYWSNKSKK